jgi:hypothetical protein
MSLFQMAFWALAAIAAGGVLMTALIAAKVRFPSFLGLGHGLGAIAATGLLFVANLRGEAETPALAWWALAVFTTGIVGGLVLFRVLFRDNATLPLALMHGSLGALGLYLLYQASF